MSRTTVLALIPVALWLALAAIFVLIGGPLRGLVVALPLFATLAIVLVGAIVAARRPGNPIGWMLGAAGVGLIGQGLSGEYATRALVIAPGSLPADVAVAWIGSWIEPPTVGLVVFLLLLFPTGRLPSHGWRPVAWLAGLAILLMTFAAAFRTGALIVGVGQRAAPLPVPNPLGLPTAVGAVELAGAIGTPLYVLVLAASVLALVLRFRAARGEERQQMKWFVYAAVTSIAIVVGSAIGSRWFPEAFRGAIGFIAFSLAMVAFPLSVGIALLRYRLYDIDLLINKTFVYGATTATIGVTFFAGIVVLQAALRPLTGGSEVAVAVSTLLSFALFHPARRWIQSAVDQRFYRSRYDAARTLDRFATGLSGEVDLDMVRADLAFAVRETLRPAHVSLWLRDRAR